MSFWLCAETGLLSPLVHRYHDTVDVLSSQMTLTHTFMFLLAVESFRDPLVCPGYYQSYFRPWFNDFDARDWEASKLCPSL